MFSTIDEVLSTADQIASPEKPSVTKELAVKLARKNYGIRAFKVEEFESYGDRNFYLEVTPNGEDTQESKKTEFVLKVLNSADSEDEEMIDVQNSVMFFLKERGISCCFPALSLCGKHTVFEISLCDYNAAKQTNNNTEKQDNSLKTNAIRLMSYVPGQPLRDAHPSSYSSEMLYSLGQYVAKLDKILKEFNHPRLKSYAYSWDLQHIYKLQHYITLKYLGTTQRVDLIKNVYQNYISTVPQVLRHLDKQVIHNDVNDRNIIIPDNINGLSHQQFSIIDFGDMCYSYRVFEVTIVMSDIMLRQFIRSGGDTFGSDISSLLRGYQSIYPLSQEELGILYWCIAGRFVQMLVIGSVKLSMEPDNTYVNDTELHIWDLLSKYLAVNGGKLLEEWLSTVSGN